MRWLINSAVIPVGGAGMYEYSEISRGVWVATFEETQQPTISAIGYQATCDHVVELVGLRAAVGVGAHTPARISYTLDPGDFALVVRLDQRVDDPTTKHDQRPTRWSYGVLRRIA